MKSIIAIVILGFVGLSMVGLMTSTPAQLQPKPLPIHVAETTHKPAAQQVSTQLAEVEAKGLFFKDKLKLVAFDDPTIEGIVCYTTYYERTMNMGDDSTDSALDCKKIGPIKGSLESKSNIFSQDKTFFSMYKETVVDRVYDKQRNVMVYISYTKSFGEKNASHSISTVPLN